MIDSAFSQNEFESDVKEINRAHAWLWAKDKLKPDASIWMIEWIKSSIFYADDELIELPAPSDFLPLENRCRILVAFSVAAFASLIYCFKIFFRFSRNFVPKSPGCLAAVHGEWSTRSSHLISSINKGGREVDGIILLGRLKVNPGEIKLLWQSKGIGDHVLKLPFLIPVSPKAFLKTILNLPFLLRSGLQSSREIPLVLPFREMVAISFRVIQGDIAANWWQHTFDNPKAKILFGITGTADTTCLERAMQNDNCQTFHFVHGQAVGPNFVAFSDFAVFRSKYDADLYDRVGCYGRCLYQKSFLQCGRRGNTGLFLLSNLAHPLNPGYRRSPLRDEIKLIEFVGAVARSIGKQAYPLYWKPHPVIQQLPLSEQKEIREIASKHGFVEVLASEDSYSFASKCHWVLVSPSTIALDLLVAGLLSVVLDPQGSILDTALCKFPNVPFDINEVVSYLDKIDDRRSYNEDLSLTFSSILPAKEMDLNDNAVFSTPEKNMPCI